MKIFLEVDRKPLFRTYCTPTNLTTLTNRTQWKCAWGARKCWNSKIWSNFDSKFYLKAKFKKFEIFKVLQFFAVFHYFFRPRLSATGVSIWLGCSKNDGRHGFREISTRNSMKTQNFEISKISRIFDFFMIFHVFSPNDANFIDFWLGCQL